MTGLSRFDFYPRDWHLDTRDLSNAAKGIYIDLLAAMYARGGPLPIDERELCRLCGCATARSLRPLIEELLGKQKLRLVDDHLVNNRAMEEIARAAHRKAIASSGGTAKAEKAVRAEFGSNSTRTQAETRADIVENQEDTACSPSPSPSSGSKEPAKEATADTLFDPEKPVFDYGKQILGQSAGGQVRNLIHRHGGDLEATMATLRLAARKQNPREYVGAIVRGHRQPETDWDAEYRRMGVS